jgi:catalase
LSSRQWAVSLSRELLPPPRFSQSCENITFNPLVLRRGIKPSADPVLLARAAPYALSLGRRLTEAAAKK